MSKKDLIVALPDERLRGKSERVYKVDAQVRKIIDDMKAATLDWETTRPHEVGVALAASQIGKPLKIIIIRQDFNNKKNQQFGVLINPKIVKVEGQIEEDYEGCLSVPDIYGKVPRYAKVRVRALDENGREIRLKAEGFLARVLQHEVDHNKGLLFIDRIKDRPDAFFKLTDAGKLMQVPYEQVEQTGIFR